LRRPAHTILTRNIRLWPTFIVEVCADRRTSESRDSVRSMSLRLRLFLLPRRVSFLLIGWLVTALLSVLVLLPIRRIVPVLAVIVVVVITMSTTIGACSAASIP
jgi:hypothetical protein